MNRARCVTGLRRVASDGEWRLIAEREQGDRLYHERSDPWENRNVADDYPGVTSDR